MLLRVFHVCKVISSVACFLSGRSAVDSGQHWLCRLRSDLVRVGAAPHVSRSFLLQSSASWPGQGEPAMTLSPRVPNLNPPWGSQDESLGSLARWFIGKQTKHSVVPLHDGIKYWTVLFSFQQCKVESGHWWNCSQVTHVHYVIWQGLSLF